MCGIAGILQLDPSDSCCDEALRRMRDVLTHRGPDGMGLIVDGPVGLAHRRLAIIDVAGGHQPMSNEDGSVWITYNGEIYNHAALRTGLEARGHRYQSRSDTETIVHLYEEKGDALVEDLRGMFAFAIWDRRQHRLLLARDRLGIKPLYYAVTSTALIFGSEIKALLATGLVTPRLNRTALPEFLATRFLSGEQTFFDGIYKLPPGHVLTWSPADGVQKRRYWQVPSPSTNGATHAPSNGSLRSQLESAVRSHLMSDVPLGVFLSGGIDSSALAAMVARATDAPIHAFAVGFDDPEANELPYARMAAQHIGANYREVIVTPQQFFESLPALLWHEDEPIAFPSSVPLYFVARLAAESVKVVLTGEGADELFLGYNRYRVTAWNARLGALYWTALSPQVRRSVRHAIDGLPSSVNRFARRTFLALEPGVRDVYLENFAVFGRGMREALVDDASLRDRDAYSAVMPYYEDSEGTLVDRMSRGDLQTYLHELLMKQDQMSMAASIESRVPFLADDLVQTVASIPGAVKLPAWQTKRLLRRAVRDLIPPAILTRRKMGFPVPLARWFRGDYRWVVDEFVTGPRALARGFFDAATLRRLAAEHGSGSVSHADRLWLLLNFEIWNRIFSDGEHPADIARVMRAQAAQTHANPLAQNGRPVAADDRRPGAQPADALAALGSAPRHADHHA